MRGLLTGTGAGQKKRISVLAHLSRWESSGQESRGTTMSIKFFKQLLTGFIACTVVFATGASGLQASQSQDAPPTMQGQSPWQGQAPTQVQPQMQGQPPMQGNPQAAQLSPQQLQELVAPIALYPDALVAQILAASAYPTQIVEAQRFLQQNPNLKGAALGAEVDKQDWDPSVKALTQFPSVLSDLDKNLSWTTTLGDANLNQQSQVMDAIQYMRREAEQAGNLKTTPQQTVTNQGSNVVIQPADPQIVYVPDYDPEFVYGYPVGIWPGFYPWWYAGGPYLSFGFGYGIGPFWGFGWGWGAWGFDWFHRGLLFGGRAYAFQGRGFYDRNAFFHGNYRGFAGAGARANSFARGGGSTFARGNSFARGGAVPSVRGNSFAGGNASGYARGNTATRGYTAPAARGYAAPSNRGYAYSGSRSGSYGGYSGGGSARGYSSGGGYHGGGGGGHSSGGGHSGGGGHGGHR
jgi:hypothetical protein